MNIKILEVRNEDKYINNIWIILIRDRNFKYFESDAILYAWIQIKILKSYR